MRVLFLGDIVGRPGRDIIREKLHDLRKSEGLDAVIANGENSSGGSGITPQIANELVKDGVDVITSGDHIWKKREVYEFLDKNEQLIRPLNYPEGAPGKGTTIFEVRPGLKIGVINLVGRVFMEAVECPFKHAEEAIKKLKKETPIVIVDLHAEATSEKVAMGWFLDGKASAVVGTHTHIQTADEKILPKGTAYITDCGMTGPFDSVIGRKKDCVISRFITQLPTKFEVADNGIEMHGVIITIDEDTGKATAIKRRQVKM